MSPVRIGLVLSMVVGGVSVAHAQPAEPAPQPPAEQPAPPPVVEPTPAPAPAPVLAPPAQTAAVIAEPEQPAFASGSAIEVRLETSQLLIDDDLAFPTTQAGVFFGHRSDKVTIGLGLELGRLSESRSGSDGMGGTSDLGTSATTLLVIPGVRFAIANSADRRTELLAQLDAGYGATFFSSDTDDTDPTSIHRLRLQAGPAIRHWVSPSFGVGATAGIRYDRLSRSNDANVGFESEMTLSNTNIFGSLQVTAVF